MIHFVGAGSGAVDLITVRGQRLLSQADLIIYAGSLVNPALLEGAKPGCQVLDSARMTLEAVSYTHLGRCSLTDRRLEKCMAVWKASLGLA